MSRRAIHIDPDGRWGRALAAIVAPRLPPPPVFVMTCIGCGETKPAGWARPGLCWGCDKHADKHVRATKRVGQMMVAAAVAALQSRRRTFRVPSLLILAFHGGDDLHKLDTFERSEGMRLDAATTVRICRDRSWKTKLIYRRTDSVGTRHSTTQHVCFAPLGRRGR